MVGIECDDANLLTSFQEGLEGDRGRGIECGLLMSFQEGLEGDRGRDRVR